MSAERLQYETPERRHELGAFNCQLVERILRQLAQEFLPGWSKTHDDFAAIETVAPPLDHPLLHETIHQLHRGVVPDLQPLGKGADRRRPTTLESLHLQEQQILLRLDASGMGGDLADAQEPSNLIAQIREGSIVETVDYRRGTLQSWRGHRQEKCITV